MNRSTPEIQDYHRLIWAMTRSYLEADNFKHRKYGEKRKRHWSLFESLIQIFGLLLGFTPLYRRGYKNAVNVVVNQLELPFNNLPESFDGYTLLHMTDLHLDFIPGLETSICKLVKGLDVDICVLTGDYREKVSGSFKDVLLPMKRIVEAVDAKDGIVATLGNHDTYQMLDHFEKMGIQMLANETIDIARGGDQIQITGLDDPCYYYTDQAISALEETLDGFKVALVHTPALFDVAADNGYCLYLCGHTHGGQICMPGGMPIILHLRHGRRYYRGLWHYGKMTGYTGQGTGTVGIPVRFNTQSEITVIRLKRSAI